MRVFGQRLDCMSHEPVYLSEMLTLRRSEFPRHADYVKEFGTCIIKSGVNTGDLEMGYLVKSRFVQGSSNDAVRRQYIVEVCSNCALVDQSASIRCWRPLQKPTWRPATTLKRYRTHRERQLIALVLRSQDPCL